MINSVLLLGFLGWVLGGEAKLAVLLLGFATGVTWQGEIGPGAAGIWHGGYLARRNRQCCCWDLPRGLVGEAKSAVLLLLK